MQFAHTAFDSVPHCLYKRKKKSPIYFDTPHGIVAVVDSVALLQKVQKCNLEKNDNNNKNWCCIRKASESIAVGATEGFCRGAL